MGEPEVRVADPAVELRRAGGFDLAHRLRDQAFRGYLSEHGWVGGRRVIMCADTDPFTYVLNRLEESGDSSAIVAIPDVSKPHGFRLATIQANHG